MNTSKLIIGAIFVAACSGAIAGASAHEVPSVVIPATQQVVNSGDAYIGYTGFISTKTRAEVIQEFREAQRRGEIYAGESYPGPLGVQTHKTRAEVTGELREYRLTHPIVSDDGAFPIP